MRWQMEIGLQVIQDLQDLQVSSISARLDILGTPVLDDPIGPSHRHGPPRPSGTGRSASPR